MIHDINVREGDWLDAHPTDFVASKRQLLTMSRDDKLDPAHDLFKVVYFLFQRGELVYVGRTREWWRRRKQHKRNRLEFDRVAAISAPFVELLPLIEWAYIEVAQPPLNAQQRANHWDAAHRLRDRIRKVWNE